MLRLNNKVELMHIVIEIKLQVKDAEENCTFNIHFFFVTGRTYSCVSKLVRICYGTINKLVSTIYLLSTEPFATIINTLNGYYS